MKYVYNYLASSTVTPKQYIKFLIINFLAMIVRPVIDLC
jgi:hypothetical protein